MLADTLYGASAAFGAEIMFEAVGYVHVRLIFQLDFASLRSALSNVESLVFAQL